jgi:MFS family permease
VAGLPESLHVLRRREFRLLLCGQAVSVFGDRMVTVALAFAVLEIGGSLSAVGLVLACANLPLVACVLAGGVVADRTSRRAVMVGRVERAWASASETPASLLATRARPRRPLVVVALTEGVFVLPLAFLAAGAAVPLLALAALLSGAAMMLGNAVWETTLQRHIPHEALSRMSSYDWFGSLVFYPLGLAIWGPVATAIGIDVSLWLAFALMGGAGLALLAIPDVRRLPASPIRATTPTTQLVSAPIE